MHRHNYAWKDHNVEPDFHEPCEKDLRVSYLEQYELNNTYAYGANDFENSREHSKNNLKQITDKYGFYWDDRGKLLKIRDKYQKKLVEDNKRNKNKQNRTQKQTFVHRVENTKFKPNQTQVQKEKKQYISPMKLQEQNTSIKHQIKNIDQRINRIVNKYQPVKASKSNISNIQEDYCKCDYNCELPPQKQYEKISFRIQTQQNYNDVPYFGAYLVEQSKPITRSKSSANFSKTGKVEKKYEERRSMINKYTDDMQGHKQNDFSRTISKKKDKKYSQQLESPSQKQIDNKIDLITQKIKQFQKQKQRLDINFKKFQFIQRPKTPQKITKIAQKPRMRTQMLERGQSSYEDYDYEDKYLKNQQLISMQHQLREVEVYQNFNQEQQQILQTPKKKIKNKERAEEIQILTLNKKGRENKRKFENKGLLEKFCRQIQLDQQFRNAKLWFQGNEDPHKWGIIADKLKVDGMHLRYKELVQIFSCQPEQHNPFFSIKNSHENYSSLISKFKENEAHWKENLQNNFTEQQLEQEQFNTRELDIEQKGHIKVEDLVRYINMRTKNFYRSRDLLLIYQRFAGKQKKQVHFSRILEVLQVLSS